ncbi:MAG: VOC family protein [Gemmatimonadaceae bacterium]
MTISGMLETCVYASDLAEAERFYAEVMGLERFAHQPGRHVFFRCGSGMFLVFHPERTRAERSLPHGAVGGGHAAFAVRESEIDGWRARLQDHGVAIEAEVSWPRGGRSLYVRDPAGNSIELATPRIWGLAEKGDTDA